MRAICGLVTPTRGEVLLGGRPVHGLPASRIARLGLVHVPEGREDLAPRSVEDHLLLGALHHLPGLFGIRRKGAEDLRRVYDLFPRLAERRGQLVGTLSGGEQRMLAIGLALMTRPKVLLLDEPSSGLAPAAAQLVLRTLRRLAAEGMALLLAEASGRAALEVADHAYVLEQGRVAAEGTPAALQRDERVVAAYLG